MNLYRLDNLTTGEAICDLIGPVLYRERARARGRAIAESRGGDTIIVTRISGAGQLKQVLSVTDGKVSR